MYFIIGSSPVWEAWIEIKILLYISIADKSSPVWEAWIEINSLTDYLLDTLGRLPYGRRGLKYMTPYLIIIDYRRLPYGRRGLKYSM